MRPRISTERMSQCQTDSPRVAVWLRVGWHARCGVAPKTENDTTIHGDGGHDDEETEKNRARITICASCFACIRLLVFHASERGNGLYQSGHGHGRQRVDHHGGERNPYHPGPEPRLRGQSQVPGRVQQRHAHAFAWWAYTAHCGHGLLQPLSDPFV